MQRTAQQTAFIQALLNTNDHIALVARAGCGKTSTILESVDDYSRAFPGHEILICAFGKAIQKEIEAKLDSRGYVGWKMVSTTHSLGFGLVKFIFKNPKINDYKVRDLIRSRNDGVYLDYPGQIAELVHLAKTEGFGFFPDVQIGDKNAWYKLADHYGVNALDDTSKMDEVVEAAQNIYRISLQQTDIIDFDDMILFPLVKNLRVRFGKDVIFLDEAQDTSRARRALVKKFLKPTGRLMIVGDDRQAIMGFAGASADALTDMIQDVGAISLPLNITWRCPKAVVLEAQKIVPDIIAADTAPEGEVLRLKELPDNLVKSDAILCRNTAPLIETAYGLLRQGVACKVEGRDIGTGLIRMIERWKRVSTITAYLTKLEDYRDRECQKARAKGQDNKIEEINDRCDTLVHICSAVQSKGLHDLSDVKIAIEAMFADNVTKEGLLTLCTYHRSKGREWQRVMLLEHSKRCPSPYAKQAWQKLQEANLAYVAITRAQHTLCFVG